MAEQKIVCHSQLAQDVMDGKITYPRYSEEQYDALSREERIRHCRIREEAELAGDALGREITIRSAEIYRLEKAGKSKCRLLLHLSGC